MSDAEMSAPAKPAARRKPLAPGLLRPAAAARYLGVGRSTLDRLNAAGRVPQPVRLGGALAWPREELAAWCRYGCPPRAEWAPVWRVLRTAPRHRPT